MANCWPPLECTKISLEVHWKSTRNPLKASLFCSCFSCCFLLLLAASWCSPRECLRQTVCGKRRAQSASGPLLPFCQPLFFAPKADGRAQTAAKPHFFSRSLARAQYFSAHFRLATIATIDNWPQKSPKTAKHLSTVSPVLRAASLRLCFAAASQLQTVNSSSSTQRKPGN